MLVGSAALRCGLLSSYELVPGLPRGLRPREISWFLRALCENCSTSGESGSTCAFVAPNATKDVDVLDVAFAEQAPTPDITMPFVPPNATKGGIEEEEAAQCYLAWASSFLASLVYVVLAFALVVPRRRSSATGAAWRSSVVGYLLFSPEIASVAAAATSVRGSDYTTAKSSKIKTNESSSSSFRIFGKRRVLTGYVMDDSSIRTAVAAWLADASAAETTYGHISTYVGDWGGNIHG